MAQRDATSNLVDLNLALVRTGFMTLLPISLMVLAFGAAFGLAAAQKGMGPLDAMLMSAIVFAGVAQFAALDTWGTQVPLITLAATVFAINARHILMGASLYPWLRHAPATQRYGVMVLVSDVNWAMAIQALGKGQQAMGILLGGGLALWTFWIVATWLGLVFGASISDGKAWGIDMVMGCFLWAMTLSGPRNLRIIMTWLVAAVASVLAFYFLPTNTHVMVGALAGGILGALWPEEVRHVD